MSHSTDVSGLDDVALVRALDAPDLAIRLAASDEVRHRRLAAAVDGLIDNLERGPERVRFANTLYWIGAAAVERLARLVGHADPQVALHAIETMASWGSTARPAVAALQAQLSRAEQIEVINDRHTLGFRAALALAKIDRVEYADHLIDAVAREAPLSPRPVLHWLGHASSSPRLADVLRQLHAEHRILEVYYSLQPDACAAVIEVVAQIYETGTELERRWAARALANQVPAAASRLRAMAEHDPDPVVRFEALHGLVRHPTLDREPWMKAAALQLLEQSHPISWHDARWFVGRHLASLGELAVVAAKRVERARDSELWAPVHTLQQYAASTSASLEPIRASMLRWSPAAFDKTWPITLDLLVALRRREAAVVLSAPAVLVLATRALGRRDREPDPLAELAAQIDTAGDAPAAEVAALIPRTFDGRLRLAVLRWAWRLPPAPAPALAQIVADPLHRIVAHREPALVGRIGSVALLLALRGAVVLTDRVLACGAERAIRHLQRSVSWDPWDAELLAELAARAIPIPAALIER